MIRLTSSNSPQAAKSAVRALADTLRLEVLRHNSARTTYTIHIAFPADFISPGFVLEQDTKPDLTKRIQGTNVATFAQLEEKFPSSEKVAQGIVARVDRGDLLSARIHWLQVFCLRTWLG